MKMKKKIYCGKCRFFKDEYCESEPKERDTSYLAPGSHKLINQLCSLKNRKNDCSEFESKEKQPFGKETGYSGSQGQSGDEEEKE